MKTGLKILVGLGVVAIALFWWFSNPARAPRGKQSSPSATSSPVQLVTQSDSQASDSQASDNQQEESVMITEFTNAQEAELWRSVDDVVMGGISDSTFSVTPEETGIFSGKLSLENNGGFASIRRNVEDVDFGGAKAIALRIKGDGRPYQFRLQTKTVNDSLSYRAEFETDADEWVEVSLPIADFEPVFRGEVIANAPELTPDKVKQIGFLLADKQPGTFRLETDWIRIER